MKKNITLADVERAIEHLTSNGEKTTCENIKNLTGGSMSTILRFKAIAVDEAEKRKLVPSGISDGLYRALLSETGKAIQEATNKYESRLEISQQRNEEILIALEKGEKYVTELLQEIAETRATREKETKEADKIISKQSQKIIDLVERIQSMRDENMQLIEKIEATSATSARHREFIEMRDQLAQKQEGKICTLENKIQLEIDARHQAEIKLAAMQERAAHQQIDNKSAT